MTIHIKNYSLIENEKISRSAGLDILRVGSTLMILLSHYGAYMASHYKWRHVDFFFIAGPIGLSGFFVLSGYLIGKILLKAIEGNPDLRAAGNFILQRLLRVMPSYLVWLFILAIMEPMRDQTGWMFIRYMTLMQNFAWPMPTSNWYGVSWSLSIEVWFYLIFGSLAMWLGHIARLRGLIYAVILFIIFPLLARLCVSPELSWDMWIRKIVVLRLDAIASGVGAALAIKYGLHLGIDKRLLFLLGLITILASVFYWVLRQHQFDMKGRISRALIFDVLQLGVVLLLPLLLGIHFRSRLVVAAWAWLSDATYAIYLVHLSMLLWAIRLADMGRMTFGLGLVLALTMTLIWAAVSLKLVEYPIRRFRKKLRSRLES